MSELKAPEFIQFTPLRRCPVCNKIHQAELSREVVEIQPLLYNRSFVCSGTYHLIQSVPVGKTYTRMDRIILRMETEIWNQLINR